MGNDVDLLHSIEEVEALEGRKWRWWIDIAGHYLGGLSTQEIYFFMHYNVTIRTWM